MTKANLSWITDTLATGGDLSALPEKALEQIEDIRNAGITHIIDTRSEANDHDVWETFKEINYVWLPTSDHAGHNIPAELFDAAVKEARLAGHGAKVFVHCHMGINRGPSVAYAILLDRGYGVTEAWDMIRAARPQAGLYYAVDALKAHHARRLAEKNLGFDRKAELVELIDHENEHMTHEIEDNIKHIMRNNHARDRQEWREVLMRRGNGTL